MSILTRYLGQAVLSSTLIIGLILLSLLGFVNLLQEANEVGHGQYTFVSAITHVLLILPSEAYTAFPITYLLGHIVGLNLLARHSELVILRSSGLSVYQIAWSLCKALSPLLIGVVLIGEFLAPYAKNWAEYQKVLLTSHGQTLLTQHRAAWVHDKGSILYIRSIAKPGCLSDVSRYQFDISNKLLNISFAKEVVYQQQRWIAKKVSSDDFFDQRRVQSTRTKQEEWPLSFDPSILKISIIKPTQMSLKQLRDYIDFLQLSHDNISQYTLAFWQRLFQPLAILLMTWLALPFAFGHLRTIATGPRTIAGLIIGFSFYLLNQFFGPLVIVYQWPTLLAAVAPIALFSAITYLLLRRIS